MNKMVRKCRETADFEGICQITAKIQHFLQLVPFPLPLFFAWAWVVLFFPVLNLPLTYDINCIMNKILSFLE